MNRPILLFCTGANGKELIPYANVEHMKQVGRWTNITLKSGTIVSVANAIEEIIEMIEEQTNDNGSR